MRNVKVELYKTKKIVNDHKRSDDGWFWTRYSAIPYKGCVHGCRYCYCWDEKYAPHADYRSLDRMIMVKENAVELLKKELAKKPRDVIAVGDWQPVEASYKLSRKMLEIVHQLRFPLMVIERAPLLCRDIDLLQAISAQTDAYVGYTIVATRDDKTRLHFEPRGPSVAGRFRAMRRIADAGIMIGTLAMPILPYIFDTDEELRLLVRMTRDAGGRFVLFGGMTLWGTCKSVFYKAMEEYDSSLLGPIDLWDTNKALKTQWGRRCHLTIAEECAKQGILHYIPRPVSFYPPELCFNKRIAGELSVKKRDIEMSGESRYRAMAYFKAARTIDALVVDIRDLYKEKGRRGLLALEGIGEKLAGVIEGILNDDTLDNP
jgi:DNA repair photolyase